MPTDTIDGAIRTALKAPEKTVLITDSGDNITAGAAGDSTFVLERLLDHHVKDAVVAGIVDPEAAAECARAGVGERVKLTVGGRIDTVFGKPLLVSAEIRRLAHSKENGRSAVVDVDGVHLVLLSVRRSFTAPEDFQEVQIDPLSHKIVVVKLGYLFAPLRKIAPRTIMPLTPGFANQLIEKLPYKNLHRPIYPLDREMTWSPPEPLNPGLDRQARLEESAVAPEDP